MTHWDFWNESILVYHPRLKMMNESQLQHCSRCSYLIQALLIFSLCWQTQPPNYLCPGHSHNYPHFEAKPSSSLPYWTYYLVCFPVHLFCSLQDIDFPVRSGKWKADLNLSQAYCFQSNCMLSHN